MILEEFDQRTFANMEVALERACKLAPNGAVDHEARSYIAARVLECARSGDKTLHGLTQAARRAVADLQDK